MLSAHRSSLENKQVTSTLKNSFQNITQNIQKEADIVTNASKKADDIKDKLITEAEISNEVKQHILEANNSLKAAIEIIENTMRNIENNAQNENELALKLQQLSQDAEQVKNQTGFSIGGVSPIAHLNKKKILIDVSLSRYEHVYAAAGHPNTIFKISYKQLIKLTEGIEENIT